MLTTQERLTQQELERRYDIVRSGMKEKGLEVLLVSGFRFVAATGYLRYLTNWAEPFGGEVLIVPADGSPICVSLTLSRLELDGTIWFALFARDVTAEVERRDRLALLHSVADRTNRAMVVTDHALKIIYTNAAFAEMFGYQPGEAIGRRADELMVGPCTDRNAIPASFATRAGILPCRISTSMKRRHTGMQKSGMSVSQR